MKYAALASLLAALLLVSAPANSGFAQAANPRIAAAPKTYANWSGVWTRARTGIGGMQDDEGARAAFRPEWQAATSVKDKQRLLLENRGADCLPQGMPQMMGMVYLMETLVQPHQFTIVSEYQGTIRRIYIDGRGHPKVMWPTFNGHSIGRWEGDVLVVETVSLMPLPFSGGILSDHTRITERMRLVDAKTFEDTITIEDPKALLKPITSVRRYLREASEINEYVCQENNHNGTDEAGRAVYGR